MMRSTTLAVFAALVTMASARNLLAARKLPWCLAFGGRALGEGPKVRVPKPAKK